MLVSGRDIARPQPADGSIRVAEVEIGIVIDFASRRESLQAGGNAVGSLAAEIAHQVVGVRPDFAEDRLLAHRARAKAPMAGGGIRGLERDTRRAAGKFRLDHPDLPEL